MKLSNLSIRLKILLVLAITFTILLVTTAVFISSSQRALVTELASEKVNDVANTYFDGVNTMMLTGTTSQRHILQAKMLEAEGVEEVTIIRSQVLVDVFGKGNEGELPETAEDNRALKGERFQMMFDNEQGRHISTWIPLLASSDYRGTNCLNCHVVPEGTVLGAVKATYSLNHFDEKVTESVISATLINLVLFILGVVVIIWLLRSVLVKPILAMRETMHNIEQQRDLTTRLDVTSKDEIGRLSETINLMLDRFRESFTSVMQTAHEVANSARNISQVSETTYNAAFSQLTETNNVATAVTELAASADEVNSSANQTAEASVQADTETNSGKDMTDRAISGIRNLIAEIEQASEVINQLDSRSQGIGHVLDVIRNIAEQTNLLALNAAIEAARAGESGRGFAVVADEVRTLATRSHESTEEIQQLIEKLQTDAKQAVETMSRAQQSASERGEQIEAAGNSLGSIANKVGEIKNLNTQMANAAREQSIVTEDVSRNISTISQIAEDTSNDAQQVNNFSQELVRLSAQLSELVDQFKV